MDNKYEHMIPGLYDNAVDPQKKERSKPEEKKIYLSYDWSAATVQFPQCFVESTLLFDIAFIHTVDVFALSSTERNGAETKGTSGPVSKRRPLK